MIQVDNINQTMDAKIIDGANLKIANKIYVAGAPENVIRKLPGNTVTDRFVGCLKNIQYSTKEGGLPLTLSKWADEILNDQRQERSFVLKGKPTIGCRLTTAKTLSFVTPESFVKLQSQVLVINPGSFSISFFFRKEAFKFKIDHSCLQCGSSMISTGQSRMISFSSKNTQIRRPSSHHFRSVYSQGIICLS